MPELGELLSQLNNDCYMVRHYHSQRTAAQRLRRHQAIRKLVATLMFTFEHTDDYEAVIGTVLDGLRPRDRPPF